jgi:uncharacterized protein
MNLRLRHGFVRVLCWGMMMLLGMALGQWAWAADALTGLDLRQVKVGGEIGRRIDVTINNNLLVLAVDKDFLLPFQKRNSRDGYVGLGKTIEAAVRFAAYTKNEKVLALKKHLVEETIKTQEPDGYIGIMVKDSRMWELWDIHEMGYIILGLTSDYHYFRETRSLKAAQKLADYIIQRWSTMPAGWGKRGVGVSAAIVGLERNLMTLYGETGDKRYLDFCVQERALPDWDLGIVVGRRDLLEGTIQAYLAPCLAQLDLCHLQPNERLLRQSRRAIDFMTARDGMTITGAAGQWECWTDDQDGRGGLGETCATAYQIRMFDACLRLEGKSRHGDVLERMIYNTLFAAQSPNGRKIRYFAPLEGNREYFPNDTYCCPCNYRRIVAELPTLVYYRSANGATVSLYTPSEATIALDDGVSLRIRQETDYPSSGKVAIHLDPSKPAKFPLQLRIPRWCDKATVSINGKPWTAPIASGEFLAMERQWTVGDRVTLDMPMPFRLVLGHKRQSGRVAVMRGPVVFCLDPSQNASLQRMDAADLTGIMIDAGSLRLLPDDSVHRGGVACSVKAGSDGFSIGVSGKLSLKLTEFPDPEGKAAYFRVPDVSMAVADEILSGDSR